MADSPSLHHRRSIRLGAWDYRDCAAYFVTICTLNRECLFGDITNGVMHRNAYGQIAEREWLRSCEVRPNLTLDEFVVMPNHVHGIVVLERAASLGDQRVWESQVGGGRSQKAATDLSGTPDVGASRWPGEGGRWQNAPTNPAMPVRPPTNALGTIVNGYKATVTRQIRSLRGTDAGSVWQRNYYEHAIRNDDDLDRIRQYIRNNPAQWALDAENTSPAHS